MARQHHAGELPRPERHQQPASSPHPMPQCFRQQISESLIQRHRQTYVAIKVGAFHYSLDSSTSCLPRIPSFILARVRYSALNRRQFLSLAALSPAFRPSPLLAQAQTPHQDSVTSKEATVAATGELRRMGAHARSPKPAAGAIGASALMYLSAAFNWRIERSYCTWPCRRLRPRLSRSDSRL